jgi:flagellin
MAFTINTNIPSLQSQEYLRLTADFQQKTINRVTSGLRIISSGDDAAGLAIANSFRSDRVVITQGVRNANDGLSTLQTIDGGINNISQLLDRARTLAAQSASGTFTGDRGVLNTEFQSVVTEIDRQAQAIGLNVGGAFARNLSVFIGGGRGETSISQITNGSVAVDLSSFTVDARALGLKGLQVSGAAAADVDEIVSDTTNTQSLSIPGFTDFYFRGAGFSDDNRVRVSVNLNGVDDQDKLVTAINSAIDQSAAGSSTASRAFKSGAVRAVILTDSSGNQKLAFQSSTGSFQVGAGDRLSNALLGNHAGNTGQPLDYIINGAAAAASTGTTFTAQRDVVVRVQGGSMDAPVDLTLAVTTSTTVDTALASLSSLVASNSALIAAGIRVTTSSAGSPLQFSSERGENFEVLAVNDVGNRLGLGNAQNTVSTAGAGFDVTAITTGPVTTVAGAATLAVSVGGGAYVTLSHTFTTTGAASEVVATLNTQFATNTTLQEAGLVASTAAGGAITISSNNGTFVRISAGSAYGLTTSTSVTADTATTSVSVSSSTSTSTLNAGGSSASQLLAFSPIRAGDDDQTITISATDSSGAAQSVALTLVSDSSGPNARSIDEAIAYINDRIQSSTNEDVRKIVAVKERDPAAGGAEKIRFLSPLAEFRVSTATNAGGSGITTGQGSVQTSSVLAGGATVDIGTQTTAEAAVIALARSVVDIGQVQAVVGRGQNQFNFAITLAQTQISNLAASESRIRDADLAAEAANLSKAQILLQAGIAALAQANSAPQQVLALLQG